MSERNEKIKKTAAELANENAVFKVKGNPAEAATFSDDGGKWYAVEFEQPRGNAGGASGSQVRHRWP